MEKEFDEELKKLKDMRETLHEVCVALSSYENRVKIYGKAIVELQTQAIMDREQIEKLDDKVKKLESVGKPKKDFMYG